MSYHFELHQAESMVMAQLGVRRAAALALLRAYGYSNDRHLDKVARDVVARTLRLDHDRMTIADGGRRGSLRPGDAHDRCFD